LIQVVVPVVDISLVQVNTVLDNDQLQIILTIANQGTLVLENFDLIIEIPGQLSLIENFDTRIGPGERINYPIDFQIIGQTGATHICFNLEVNEPDMEEQNTFDNFDCINLDEEAVFLDSYPNPVSNELVIPMVLPVQSRVDFQVLTTSGALVLEQSFADPQVGLTQFSLELSALRQGLYLLRTRYGNVEKIQKIVKQ